MCIDIAICTIEALYRRCHLTTVQLVSVYYGMPSYTAYSGSSDSVSPPSQKLVSDGCNSDLAIVGDDLENIKSGPCTTSQETRPRCTS